MSVIHPGMLMSNSSNRARGGDGGGTSAEEAAYGMVYGDVVLLAPQSSPSEVVYTMTYGNVAIALDATS